MNTNMIHSTEGMKESDKLYMEALSKFTAFESGLNCPTTVPLLTIPQAMAWWNQIFPSAFSGYEDRTNDEDDRDERDNIDEDDDHPWGGEGGDYLG